ncbi:MAG: cell division protein FtsZ [Deltaproteobacteria bacterium]|nr:cell division protein FtsZ [Deltaproteobacteria bacterium]
MFEVVVDNNGDQGAVIKIVGVGSGGVNAVNTMIASEVDGVEYIAMNTDFQHLNQCVAETCLELNGPTRGRGAGGDPAKGREAAIQERERIQEIIKGADMVVLATGLGGGTGTGATPVVAEVARENGILTVAIVTLPFSWEGNTKGDRALVGLEDLKKVVDAYTVIPNDKLKKIAPKNIPTLKAFQLVDQFLCESMTGLVELISRPGYINRDFEDVKAVLKNCGMCIMGSGTGEGDDRAEAAVESALYNPLLEDTPIEGARNILVNVLQGPDGTTEENEVVMTRIKECLAVDGDVSFGLAFDDRLDGRIKVTIVASGMGDIEVIEPMGAIEMDDALSRVIPSDAQGMPNYASRPILSDQAGLDRVRASRNKLPPYSINENQVGFGESTDNDSELDPTPAYLRYGTDIRVAPARGGEVVAGTGNTAGLVAPGAPDAGPKKLL